MNKTNGDPFEIELKREEFSRIISFAIFCAIPATLLIPLVFLFVAFSKKWYIIAGMGIPALMGLAGAWLATFAKPNYDKQSLIICVLLVVGVLLGAPFLFIFLFSQTREIAGLAVMFLILSPSVMAYKYIRACFAIKGAKNA